ncbi:MAG TPA: RAMP superfamily CRISPR-associated protein [Paludibaculum sp.]|jgi:CRISPR-associated protein Csm5
MADETRIYRLIPLTPVHFGTGAVLNPEEYALDGVHLVRLDARAILRRMNGDGRAKYESLLDRGDLKAAQELIQKFWVFLGKQDTKDADKLVRHRSFLGEGSREELRSMVERPERNGAVNALPRNPHTGCVTIPGTGIKGALRTAITNWFAESPDGQKRVRSRMDEEGRRWNGQAMEEAALQYTRREMERDPLRLVHVSDGEWPADCVRVDQGRLRKLGADPGSEVGVQVHAERLLSRADGEEMPESRITIRLETKSRIVATNAQLFPAVVTWKMMKEAADYFFLTRLKKELDTFQWLARGSERWAPATVEANQMILRVGRWCHFDSLSVNVFREGENHRTHEKLTETGATRMSCDLATGGEAPYGWVLLDMVP